jgi:hypothetical protein
LESQLVTEYDVYSESCEEGADHTEVGAAEATVDTLEVVEASVADEEQSESLSLDWLLVSRRSG